MHRKLIAACALLSLAAVRVAAQCTSEPLAALFPKALPNNEFGTGVALQDKHLFVSSPGWVYQGVPWGALTVFAFFGGKWIHETSIVPVGGPAGPGFGEAIVAREDWLAVGAPTSPSGPLIPGAVFVFKYAGGVWALSQKLVPAEGGSIQFFGAAIAVDRDRMAIGGWGDSPPFESGAAWIFERSGSGPWLQVAKLKPADLGFGDLFGSAVALSGDWLAVGTPGDNSPFGPGGHVYVFHRDAAGTWTQTQVLQSTAFQGGDYFGYRLAMEGDTLLVSAHLEQLSPASFDAGAVYDFEREGSRWVLAQKLVAHDPDHPQGFGAALALQHDRVAIGTGVLSSLTDGPGSVQLFERANGVWTRVGTLDAPAALGAPASFGGSLALDGTRVAAGCNRDNVLGVDAGEVYAFDVGEPHLPVGAGLPGKGGFVPELLGFSCGLPGAQELTLTVQHGLGGALGALIAGAGIADAPFKGGVLYPSSPWRILPHVLGGAPGAAGDGSWELTGPLPPGLIATRFAVQAIYADPAAVAGWSLSAGLQIAVP